MRLKRQFKLFEFSNLLTHQFLCYAETIGIGLVNVAKGTFKPLNSMSPIGDIWYHIASEPTILFKGFNTFIPLSAWICDHHNRSRRLTALDRNLLSESIQKYLAELT